MQARGVVVYKAKGAAAQHGILPGDVLIKLVLLASSADPLGSDTNSARRVFDTIAVLASAILSIRWRNTSFACVTVEM
jgi:hypothetical protein